MIYFLDIYFFYSPSFCITRILVILLFVAIKVAKAFFIEGGEVL